MYAFKRGVTFCQSVYSFIGQLINTNESDTTEFWKSRELEHRHVRQAYTIWEVSNEIKILTIIVRALTGEINVSYAST